MSHRKAKAERHPISYSEVSMLFRRINEKNRWFNEMMLECQKMLMEKQRELDEQRATNFPIL
jgi:hypothetical protein